MKTWGEIKNEALGLMFSNVNGSAKVSTKDADVQEYVLNMIDAANYAIRDLSAAVPILRFYPFTITQPEIDPPTEDDIPPTDTETPDTETPDTENPDPELPDAETPTPVEETNKNPVPTASVLGMDWYLMPTLIKGFRSFADESHEMYAEGFRTQGTYLKVPTSFVGTVLIPYYAYAPRITDETGDDYDLDMLPECEDLIPIYMASRLYMEDDVQLATMYRNQYEAKKEELAARADLGMSGSFANTTGWW